MTLPLTPAMLEAAYEFLRTTPPFRRWKLPSGAAIVFIVTKATDYYGHLTFGDPPEVRVSSAKVGSAGRLLETMAHEMVHLHAGFAAGHGPRFQRAAAIVCNRHHFDLKSF